jgi:hypothetical protein
MDANGHEKGGERFQRETPANGRKEGKIITANGREWTRKRGERLFFAKDHSVVSFLSVICHSFEPKARMTLICVESVLPWSSVAAIVYMPGAGDQ